MKKSNALAFVAVASIAIAACGSSNGSEVAFAPVQGRIVGVTEKECRIVPYIGAGPQLVEGGGADLPAGPCSEIIPIARGQEYRNAEPRRVLEISYAYTSPADGQFYQGKDETDISATAPLPRLGDNLEVFAHPDSPLETRLKEHLDEES